MTATFSERSLTYQMICSTVKLSAKYRGRESSDSASATGFFFDFDGKPVIITNRHVLIDGQGLEKPAVEMRVRYVRIVNGERRLVEHTIDLENEQLAWSNDDDIDLAAITINGLISQLDNGIQDLDHHLLSISNLPSADYIEAMDPIEEVFMIGYPAGKIEELHGLPLVRKGITAVPYQLGYKDDESKDNGIDSFLLDIECVKGSSGSPVFAAHKESIVLLGVNRQNRWQKERVDGISVKNANVTYNHPIHLSVCTKSRCILELQETLNKGGDDIREVGRMATPAEVEAFFGAR